jgi:hypothetical protein
MAIDSKSKLREILEDERAVAIINEYIPGFTELDTLQPCLGMKFKTLLSFPQVSIEGDARKELLAKIDALDA